MTNESEAVAIVETGNVIAGVKVEEVRRDIEAIRQFQVLVQSQLKKDHDFGVIPGTGTKATLLKPGAEKVAKLLKCADQYEIVQQVENWDKPLFSYTIKAKLVSLVTGQVISEGVGECNSMESKYRWRWEFGSNIPNEDKKNLKKKEFTSKAGKKYEKYQIPNDEVFSQKNTILKMAKKRALVDAALSAGRLSDLFTQDIEELVDNGVIEGEVVETIKPHEKKEIMKKEPESQSEELKKVWGPANKNPDKATREQVKTILDMTTKTPHPTETTDWIYKHYNVKKVIELSCEQADELIKSLEEYEKKRTK